MHSSIWLRIASVLTLIHAVLHTVGGMFGGPRNALQSVARASSQTLRFDAFGRTRSYWNFYFGFGLMASLTLLLLTALLYQFSSLVKTNPDKTRPFLLMLLATFVIMACISWFYFFAAPFVFEIVIAVCIGAAYLTAGRSSRRSR